MTPRISVHIGELILDGFPRRDGRAIGEAVQQHLVQLFSERGVPAAMQQSSEMPRVDAGSVSIGAGAKPAAVGTQIANAVYGVSRP